MIGERLALLRRELAYLDHDLVLDGRQLLYYCVHCHVGDIIPLDRRVGPDLLSRARHHHAVCPARTRRQGANGGPDAGAPA